MGRACHPDGTECHPDHWWTAVTETSAGLLDDVAGVSVSGRQHGMVAIDSAGQMVRSALLWNDTRASPEAEDLMHEAREDTLTRLRWPARSEPGNAARVVQVMLPRDWLT
jgi:xylulokinase